MIRAGLSGKYKPGNGRNAAKNREKLAGQMCSGFSMFRQDWANPRWYATPVGNEVKRHGRMPGRGRHCYPAWRGISSWFVSVDFLPKSCSYSIPLEPSRIGALIANWPRRAVVEPGGRLAPPGF